MENTYKEFCRILIHDMFKVQSGETIAFTADSGSDFTLIKYLTQEVEKCEAKPLTLIVPKAKYDGQDGMAYWPHETLTPALCQVDVWIDLQSIVMLYSDIWETAMAKNKKLRYLIIGDTPIESLVRTFAHFDIPTLKKLLMRVLEMAKKSKRVHIKSANGTDVYYDIDLNYTFDIDDGDYSQPIFGTAPGYVNIVPKLESMNGRIVFDTLMNADLTGDNHVEFIVEGGKIVKILGNTEAEKFIKFLASFDDENMYKISHNMIGLNPGVKELSGDIVEDERVWGGVDFGFGYTSPMDMPPFGQQAVSHFDGVVEKVTLSFDDKEILTKGEISLEELLPFVEQLERKDRETHE
ncbi:hypothetical protein KMW28_28150 [Flammeovirga yaeyamensis]|uniref:Leucyl aminopeptidase n=2 Tax=Flammeovirga yaeyamensis TaxID=367791 RepID=A0AAX1NB67_9BACT|nr:hypothetical protein [Flammeovirga yaeyamensis]MBB3697313.1 leucyl aminopeptidase (aminopeptidase T) [Flammeovirga yaeyamensis]NMF33969.1 hypothetical protein [Flammeovirga yaeyamensis]QWG04771.1 hypothetical protein KMW28_28150 [Flammeovirga yaeyamensis]